MIIVTAGVRSSARPGYAEHDVARAPSRCPCSPPRSARVRCDSASGLVTHHRHGADVAARRHALRNSRIIPSVPRVARSPCWVCARQLSGVLPPSSSHGQSAIPSPWMMTYFIAIGHRSPGFSASFAMSGSTTMVSLEIFQRRVGIFKAVAGQRADDDRAGLELAGGRRRTSEVPRPMPPTRALRRRRPPRSAGTLRGFPRR